jgi:hypothetical protein
VNSGVQPTAVHEGANAEVATSVSGEAAPAPTNEPTRARILFEVVPSGDTELALQAGGILPHGANEFHLTSQIL